MINSSNLTSEVQKSAHTARAGVLRHDEGCKRFILLVDGGHEAILDYDRVETNDALTFDLYHTEVPEALRGKGFGKVLAKGAFDELLAAHPDATLILRCTFLQHFYASNKSLFAGKEDGANLTVAVMSLEQVACEDLKAFERRLTEIISSAQPAARTWRLVLAVASLIVAVGAFFWLGDPLTAEVSFVTSLWNHPFFSTSALAIIVLLLFGIHRRVVAPSIFVQRAREVLYDFAMDCDDTGKLILRPRPATA